MKRTRNTNKLLAALGKLIMGVEQHLGDGGEVQLLGRKWTVESLTAALRGHIDELAAIRQLHQKLKGAVSAQRQSYVAELLPLVLALRAYAEATWGPTSDELTHFGFATRRQTRTQTPESKVKAAARARATRKARKTMGRRQRQHIHGDVREVTIALAAGGTGEPTLAPVVEASSSGEREDE
jgi:hypothetical protein